MPSTFLPYLTKGGSVAKYLLNFPSEYSVRCLTRNPASEAAQKLKTLGAEIVEADLTKPETLERALEGCWGCFGVTNFYDSVLIPLYYVSVILPTFTFTFLQCRFPLVAFFLAPFHFP